LTLTERAVEAAVSGMLEEGLVERIVAEVVKQGTLERVIDELVAAGLLEQIIDALIARGLVDRIVDDVIASGTVERVASSPEFRAAVTGASTGMAGEMMGALQRRAVKADDRAEALVRRMLRRGDRDGGERDA
jgi:hypothetical protein